jgi:hypothetical protein
MTTYEPAHLAPTPPAAAPRRRWSRRAVLGTASIAVATVVGVAIAAVLARGEFLGGGNVLDPTTDVKFTGAPVVGFFDMGACTATHTTDAVTLTFTDATPGQVCTVDLPVRATQAGFLLQDVKFKVGTVNTLIVQRNTTPSNTNRLHCGDVVPTTAGKVVTARFVVPAGAPVGSFVADVTAGVTAINSSDYLPANCPGTL